MFVSIAPAAVDGVGPPESAAVGGGIAKTSSGARLCAASIRFTGRLRHGLSQWLWFERAARP
jgi:hypothetical protein